MIFPHKDRRIGNITIAVIEPTAAGNIGAIARAMANFGFEKITLVAPRPFDMTMAESFACNGAHILSGITAVSTFDEAIDGADTVIGMTRRAKKSEATVPVSEAAEAALFGASSGKTVIVFGRERSGLNREEKKKCTVLSHIDSADGPAGSLNLSHSALLVMHEIFRASRDRKKDHADPSPVLSAFERFCEVQDGYSPGGRIQTIFRSIIARSAPNADEVKKLTRFFGRCASKK
jgi:tRNA/rRNA methyltransferase